MERGGLAAERQTIDRGVSNPTTAVSKLGHFVRTTLFGDYAWGSKRSHKGNKRSFALTKITLWTSRENVGDIKRRLTK